MADEAVRIADAANGRIGVIATLPTTLEPTRALIEARAAAQGREVQTVSHLCDGAFQAVSSGDTETHDRIVREGLLALMDQVDVIVLAQASMARVVDTLVPATNSACRFCPARGWAWKRPCERSKRCRRPSEPSIATLLPGDPHATRYRILHLRLGRGDLSRPRALPAMSFLTAADLIDRAVRLRCPVVQICVLTRPGCDGRERACGHSSTTPKTADVALEVGTMGSDVDHLLQFLRIATATGRKIGAHDLHAAVAGLVQERRSVERIEPQYAAAGVTLAIENYEMTGFDDLRAFVQGMDSEYVGVCLDTVNSLGRGEGVREVTDALMPYTKCLHVKDFRVVRNESNMAFAVVGAPAGEGLLDVPAQMRMLASVHAGGQRRSWNSGRRTRAISSGPCGRNESGRRKALPT